MKNLTAVIEVDKDNRICVLDVVIVSKPVFMVHVMVSMILKNSLMIWQTMKKSLQSQLLLLQQTLREKNYSLIPSSNQSELPLFLMQDLVQKLQLKLMQNTSLKITLNLQFLSLVLLSLPGWNSIIRNCFSILLRQTVRWQIPSQ